MSKNAGKSEMKQANALMRDNIAKLEAVGVPTIEAQKVALQSPELVDQYVAEMMNPDAYENIQQDPRFRQSGLEALAQTEQLAQTGFGPIERAALNQVGREAAGAAEAQQASTLQEMASRGMGDSGANLIAQLNAGQSQADRMSQEGSRLAAQAAAARREALGQQANMSSQMSAQDLGVKNKNLDTKLMIGQFNAQGKNQAARDKQGYLNQRASEVANIGRQQEMYNKGLQQQDFQNRMGKATGVMTANSNLANQIAQQGQAAAQGQAAQNAALIGGATSLAGAGIGAYGSVAAANAKAAPAATASPKYDANGNRIS
jgi:hypothetical protein